MLFFWGGIIIVIYLNFYQTVDQQKKIAAIFFFEFLPESRPTEKIQQPGLAAFFFSEKMRKKQLLVRVSYIHTHTVILYHIRAINPYKGNCRHSIWYEGNVTYA